MLFCLSVRKVPEVLPNYKNTISETIDIAKMIDIQKTKTDGRIDSAIKEGPFLKELKKNVLKKHPSWQVIISPPRASYDIMINSIQINVKLTECKSRDNSMNKQSIYFSITGKTDYPYSSTWNMFLDKMIEAKSANQIKQIRDKSTEYHYLVKNKITGEILLKPIFDIHTYVSNPTNNLQINWKNEFDHKNYFIEEKEYLDKVQSLLFCIQKSVREMIVRTNEFAQSDMKLLFK